VTQPIPYVSDDETRREARPPRSAGTWAKLLLVWGVGLVIWALYIVAILYVFFRVML
jgi:hypothetical protein